LRSVRHSLTYRATGLLENQSGHSYNAGVMIQPPETISHPFGTIAIVGVGLIGGSIALAAKSRGVAQTVIGVGRNALRLEQARRAGIIDEGLVDPTAAARRADLLVFCTPVDRIAAGVREAAQTCCEGTLITDVGSIKGSIARGLAVGLPGGVAFVGSHPLAGSEQQGFQNADARLFENRICVVTPLVDSLPLAVEKIARFWEGLGMTVVEMTPEAHDAALAETSHFPHLAAAALAGTLSAENVSLAASGFRDTTRIASGDPDLWTAIFLANRRPVLASLTKFDQVLAEFRQALEHNDAEGLKKLLVAAKENRERNGKR
jgi:prephenate dehydrogenase